MASQCNSLQGLKSLKEGPEGQKPCPWAFSKKSKRCCSVAWCSSSRACAHQYQCSEQGMGLGGFFGV